AADDAITAVGINGAINAGNVLVVNPTGPDTLNGSSVVIGLVDLVVIATAIPISLGSPVPSIDISSGQVNIPANTPAGTYTLIYSICEKLNPTNCDTATVTVTVVAPTMTITTNSYCSNDVPYVSYSVTPDNFVPTGL